MGFGYDYDILCFQEREGFFDERMLQDRGTLQMPFTGSAPFSHSLSVPVPSFPIPLFSVVGKYEWE